jgi:hypothetical protein
MSQQFCTLSIPRTRPDAKEKEQARVRELVAALEKVRIHIAREEYTRAYQTAREALLAQNTRPS